ncbi:hypothetical protein [Mycolicibacterium fortuitum]|uniref:hypothetical protein n=1 Tax=Mycolicibacterium fortuitum TaxID=1766 RepID=UPI0024204E81|nr:hypothetical protein [Mycolicibacterium fortuitum]MDG5769376.1 hypothetical protein [Mycolicibacterium fortuitum]MDG5780407.1 hypothetical protein [Mycolicibacterium fortuitum]
MEPTGNARNRQTGNSATAAIHTLESKSSWLFWSNGGEIEMDPLSLAAISTAAGVALTSAATQAGKQSIDGLVGLLKRLRRPDQQKLANQVESHPETIDAEVLARVLHDEAHQNPDFAAHLQQWVREQTNFSGNVSFNNNGPVGGNITQIGNVSGPVTFN